LAIKYRERQKTGKHGFYGPPELQKPAGDQWRIGLPWARKLGSSALPWFKWLIVLMTLGALDARTQTTPPILPNKIWSPPDPAETRNWLNAGNWTPNGIPINTDDVGIGQVGSAAAQITFQQAAVAGNVTLGVLTEAGYSPGELDVDGGTLTVAPLAGTGSSVLQVLSGSTLQILDGGLVNLGGFAIDNFGQINIGPNESFGTLIAGRVDNEKTGIISGGLEFDSVAGGTVVNAGQISGRVFSGVTGTGIVVTEGPGNIVNTGTISGSNAIELDNGGSVVNSGSVTGTQNGEEGGGVGIEFNNGGSVVNNAGGKITGTNEGILSSLPFSGTTEGVSAPAAVAPAPAVTIENSGTISGATGIEADAGGSVTNNAGGVIQGTGGNGIVARPTFAGNPSPLTVDNSGFISGSGAAAIDLEGGGSISNNAGGVIASDAENPAIIANGGTLTFSNAGTITGSVTLDNLPETISFVNHATLVTGGSIAGDLDLGTNAGTTLTLDGTGSEALSQAVTGLITNDGSVIKQGSGTWIIDKSLGDYAGGTTVAAGTLSDELNNALGTGGIAVTGATSALKINQGVTITNPILLTEGGTVDNSGRIANPLAGLQGGAGGGNVINEGTGVITNAVTDAILFSAGGTVTNQVGGLIQSQQGSGVDALAGPTTIVNSGNISGATGLRILGEAFITNNSGGIITGNARLAILSSGGSTKLSNAGTINGNVSLSDAANTAQLFSGGRINGNLNLGKNPASNLVLDGSTEQAYSQAVTGTTTNAGSLTKQGSGNWLIDVALNAPVSTKVLAGVLTVNNSLTSPLVTVQTGGLLKGSGVIIGNLVNVGAISPGNSPGTLTINGNFTQGAAGTYNVQIFSAQNYSRLVVTGHASLDGTLHLTLASGFRLAPGDKFTVLTAGGGISGTFRTITSNSPVNVSYQNGVVDVKATAAAKAQQPQIHLSDGTPDSTTALLADYTFYGFGSLSERMAVGLDPTGDTSKENAVSLTFDAGEFDVQGQHGQTYTIPIAGGFKINNRVRLDYQIPLQYITIEDTGLFQAGLTLDLPVKVIVPSPDQPFSWIVTPTAAVATSGGREIIGGGALTNVFAYQWHGITATYGNYLSFFEGDVLTNNDPKFQSGVSQQIMKNGLRLDVPFARSWIIEAYGIYTQFFQSALISNYFTIGAELGHHFTWDVQGQHLDLGFLSLGLYSEFGNHYSSGHAQIGSAWRF
jgi:autotransporter-associated beta strand protein